MLNQDLSKVLAGHVSRYSLVTATAKLARSISDKNLEDNVISTEKPVSLAIEEIANGNLSAIEIED